MQADVVSCSHGGRWLSSSLSLTLRLLRGAIVALPQLLYRPVILIVLFGGLKRPRSHAS